MHIFQYMLERTDAITNAVLEPITFVLAYPTVVAGSMVGVVARLRDGRPVNRGSISIWGTGQVSSTKHLDRHSSQFSFLLNRLFSAEVKRPGRETGHLPLPSAEVNECPPYAFMAYAGTASPLPSQVL